MRTLFGAVVACILAPALHVGIANGQSPNPVTVTQAITAATSACPAIPAPKSSFLTTDSQVLFDFTYTGGNAGDNFSIQWFEPSGALYVTYGFTQSGNGGSYCYQYGIAVSGNPPAGIPGPWSVKLLRNSTQIYSLPFTIAAPPSPQTITFGAIPNQIFGISPLQVTAEASSGLPVGIASATPAVCKCASGLITLLGPGRCSITATQPGNSSYSAATPVTRTFTVSAANPSGTLTAAASSPFAVGSGPISVAVGDFNGDGIQDLALANAGGNNVTVLLGNGSGGFTAATGSPFAVGASQPFSVVVGDFNGDGIQDLATANPFGNNVTVLLGNGSGGFTAATGSPFAAGANPESVVVGDFNGDGIQDLATANNNGNNVTVLLGNGSGGFTAATGSPFAVGQNPQVVVVGDFNGDGIQDLAAANYGGNNVTVLLGNGSGGFAVATGSPFTVGAGPVSVVVGDFNGDGIQDLATANQVGNNVTVLLGNGSGGFTAATGSPFGVGTGPYSVVVGDFNGDGIQDLATANGSNNATVLLGNGSGGFTAATGSSFAVGNRPQSVAVGDFNGDGVQDLATANTGSNNVTVVLGAAAPTSSVLSTTSPSTITVGQSVPLTLTVSDTGTAFNAPTGTVTFFDGSTALGPAGQTTSPYSINVANLSVGTHNLSASYAGDTRNSGSISNTITITVQLQSQTITFAPLNTVALGVAPFSISATASSGLTVAFNSNTMSVCTVNTATVTILTAGTCSITASQTGNGTYAAATPVTRTFTVAGSPSQTITFDAVPNQIFGISPFPIAAQSSVLLPVTFTSMTSAVCTASDDLVMLLGAGACSITASQSGGRGFNAATPVTRSFTVSKATLSAGSFTAAPNSPFVVGTSPFSVAVGDFNGDGKPDIASANFTAGTVTILLGDGSGGFAAATGSPFRAGADPIGIAVGDFNGDGFQDIAIANYAGNNVTVLLGNGQGVFAPAPGSPFTVGSAPQSISLGDFNGDGIQDLATPNFGDSTVTVLLGNGSGGFTQAPGSPFAVGTEPISLAVGDFNRDGIEDIATENFGSNSGTVLLGNGSGGFSTAPAGPFAAGIQPTSVAVGDFNGDGNPDLASTSSGSAAVAVLLGNGQGGFSPAPGSPFAVGSTPYSVAVGDFNGDGIPDLVTANYSAGTLTVLLGNGSGGFAPAPGSPYTVGSSPLSVAVADFNGDGIEDIVSTANPNSTSDVAVLLGGGAGPVGPPSITTTTLPGGTVGTAYSQTLAVTGGVTPYKNFTVVSGALPPGLTLTASTGVIGGTPTSATGSPLSFSVTVQDNVNSTSAAQSLSITIQGQAQTITFAPLNNVALGVAPFTISATASSGLTVTFNSNTMPVCTVNVATVTIVSTGTCSITASQAGNGTYAAATPVTQSFTVNGSSQTITFDAIRNQILGGSPFVTAAKASSGLPVGLASNTPAVCKTASVLVQLLSAGTCSITASQPGNGSYSAATPVMRSFTVSAAKPSNTFTAATGSPLAVGTEPVSVAVGDFNGDGIQDLAVANAGNNNAGGNNVTVLLGNGSGGFTAAAGSPFAAGSIPKSVVVGDFNGDGIQDLAVADLNSNQVTLLLGNGSGGFAPGSSFAVGLSPVSLVVGDFNGDGIQDLAVANAGGNVTVLLGNGSGGFTAAAGSPFAAGANPYFVVVGDFNGDGIQDLATANNGSNNVTVLLGNGSGGFTVAPGSPFAAGTSPYSMTVGDFNGDGIQDLATANNGSSNVTVLLGNGSGGFTAAAGSPFAVGSTPYSLAVGDFNGDGIQDLATANGNSNNVTVLLGNGSGGFTAAATSPFAVGSLPFSVAVGDFNGDGIQDLAVVNGGSNNVTVLLGVQAGPPSITTTSLPGGTVATAYSQTLAASGGVAPYKNWTVVSGSLPPGLTLNASTGVIGGTPTSATGSPFSFSVTVQDSANSTSAAQSLSISIQVQAQTITFAPLNNVNYGVASFTISATASSGLTVTFNSNTMPVCTVNVATVTIVGTGTCSITASQAGNGTYAAAIPVTRTFTVSFGSQNITFDAIPNQILGVSPFIIAAQSSARLPVTFSTTTSTICVTAGDLVMLLSTGSCSITATQGGNGNASAATPVTRSFTVSKATPSAGSFTATPTSPVAVGTSPFSVAVGDFNGDGIPDLATANLSSNNVTVLLGNGSGGFAPASGSPFAAGSEPIAVVVGDFNGDGIQDFATANYAGGNVTVLLGNGSGGFALAPGSPFTVGSNPYSLVLGDFNGDGIQDLATANYGSSNVTVLLGNGLGGFAPAPGSPFAVSTIDIRLAVGDFNRDGIQDLVIANYNANTVTVLLGTASGGFNAAPGSPFTTGADSVSVAVGDFNGDGIQDLAIANVGNSVTVLLGNGSGGFSPAPGSPFTAGSEPYSVTVGDFNGDGIPDLVTANLGGTATVLLGNGSGGFTQAPGSPFAAGVEPISVGVADFNGDGIEDLAVANYTGTTVAVLLGGGVGQVGPPSITTTTLPGGTVGIAYSQTLAVTNGVTPYKNFTVVSGSLPPGLALNASTGVISGMPTTVTGSPFSFSVTVQDNANSTSAAQSLSIAIQVQTQTITFALLSNVNYGVAPFTISATASSGLTVTFNSNTMPVCTVNVTTVTIAGTGTCSITASQAGNGTYPAATPVTRAFTVNFGSQTITFDAIPNQIFGISPFPIAAQSSALIPVAINSLTHPVCTTAGDSVMLLHTGTCSIRATQDGNNNFNAATSVTRSFTVSFANPSGTLTAAAGSPFAAGTGAVFVLTGDFNRDGIPDLAAANVHDNNVTVLLGNGSGGFAAAPASPFPVGPSPQAMVVGDFNGDGIQDLATANSGDNTVTVLLGNGSGGFATASGSPPPVGTNPESVVVGDFNGDGIQDLAVANTDSNNVTVLLGNGLGGFTAAAGGPFPVGSGPFNMVAGDFNRDGIQDLATENLNDNNVTVLLGNGSGGFAAAPGSPFAVGTSPFWLVVGDFNGDGIQDLAAANNGSGNVTVLLGNGSGGFTAASGSPVAVGASPSSLVVGDFNGDGIQDLAVANFGSNNVTLLMGNGTGGFTVAPGNPFAVGTGPANVAVGDFNGDGIEDLATANDGSNNVTVLLGQAAAPSITTTTLPGGTAGTAYSQTLAATSGVAPYKNWTVVSGALPPGLTLNAGTGVISGTPTSATGSPFAFSVTVQDSANNTSAATNLSIAIVAAAPPPPPPLLTISSSTGSISTTPGGSVSASFSASGGTPPYTFSATGLPGGVTVSSSGSLSGSPSAAGTFNASVTVTDSKQVTASTSITINVLGLTTTTLPNGTQGQFYSATVNATGGSGFVFSATGLPSGLSISGSGSITGTPTTAGTFTVAVTVTSGGASARGNLGLTIAQPKSLSITSGLASAPAGTVNVAYSQTLTASGGLPPYTWTLSGGALPLGLALSSSGILSGTPTMAGSFSFGVQVMDTSGAIATSSGTLKIQPAPLTITTKSLPSGMNGVDYPQQQLMAGGGVSPYTWAVSGGGSLPAGMTLSSIGVLSGVPTVAGTFSVGVTVTDQATPPAQSSATVSLTIRPAAPDLILTSSSLGFTLMSPAVAPPPSQAVGVQSTVASSIITYTASVSPAVPWLAIANGNTTPDSIQVSITSAALGLSPGTYTTTITATCTSSSCMGHMQSVAVSMTVTAAPPQLQISTGLLSFATTNSALGAISQPINVQNAGGGSLGFSSVTCEAAYCTVGSVPSSLGGGVSAAVQVTVNPSLLTPGFYRTQVDFASSGGQGSVPVTLFISANATMTLAPAGGLFNQPAGSAPGNPNGTFLVSVNSPTPVTFSAVVLPGASWLVANTTTGVATSAFPGTVSYSINPAAAGLLAVGVYYGEIQVSASGISNSPQNFEVVLNVSPAPAPVTPDPEPGGLLFITTVGGIVPPQTVTVYSGSVTPLTFQASATTVSGGGWLSVTPATGSASQSSPGVTTVSVNASKLSAGVYQGGVSYSLSATAVRTVNVTLIVGSTGGTGGASAVPGLTSISSTPSSVTPNAEPRANGCTPKKLVPAQTGLVQSFFAPAGWPTPLAVLLFDDCGTMVNNGQIVATFSNGDPPLALPLANPSQGLYSGTWSPASPSSQVTISVTASAPNFAAATSPLTGAVAPNAVPLLSPNGTLHVFDSLIGGALAPGTIVAIYGQNLAAATGKAATVPLPPAISNSSVIIGGMQAPLYYVSPGQIDAQIPFELLPAQQYQVIVSAGGALTTPQSIQLSAATPGLAASPDGTLIAQHSDGTLVTQTSPAKAGEYLVAYLAGLGATTVPVTSGTASPTSPLATPSNAPVLTINGAQSPIYFAGLTPGFVGLYQINFQVPAGLAAGNITVVVSQNGQASNQTVLPYQP